MKEYFEYLTELRDGGTINMMGAPRELQYKFGLDKAEAREIFSKWCDSLKNEQCQARDTPVAAPSVLWRQGFILGKTSGLVVVRRLTTTKRLNEETSMENAEFNAELRDCNRINEIAEQREVSRDEQAYHNACDQGHDWDDYEDPVNLYGEDGFYGFNG